MVLLKNNGILPLKKESVKTIGIIGPNADSRAALAGNYHGTASRYRTIQEGIQDYVGGEIRVLTSVGCHLWQEKTENLAVAGDRLAEAAVVADESDVVILCVGLDETLEGEEGDTGNSYASGDKIDLQLPAPQRELMEVVAKSGKPVVLCVMSGSALDLSYGAEHFDAVLQLWYPGSEGGKAAAKVLFGEVSPSGKLPVTFYDGLDDLPAFEDYSMKGRTYRYMEGKAQYPFGYGLTYGDTAVTDARLADAETADDSVVLEADVENKGTMAAEEVLQVYVEALDSADAPKNPTLCAFARVALGAGETKTVKIMVPADAFTVVDEEGNRKKEGKTFRLHVGFGQPDARTKELTGKEPAVVTLEK